MRGKLDNGNVRFEGIPEFTDIALPPEDTTITCLAIVKCANRIGWAMVKNGMVQGTHNMRSGKYSLLAANSFTAESNLNWGMNVAQLAERAHMLTKNHGMPNVVAVESELGDRQVGALSLWCWQAASRNLRIEDGAVWRRDYERVAPMSLDGTHVKLGGKGNATLRMDAALFAVYVLTKHYDHRGVFWPVSSRKNLAAFIRKVART